MFSIWLVDCDKDGKGGCRKDCFFHFIRVFRIQMNIFRFKKRIDNVPEIDRFNSNLQGNTTELFVYLDDIVIYARFLVEHRIEFNKLVQCLRNTDVKLHSPKCEFYIAKWLLGTHSKCGSKTGKNCCCSRVPVPKMPRSVRELMRHSPFSLLNIKDHTQEDRRNSSKHAFSTYSLVSIKGLQLNYSSWWTPPAVSDRDLQDYLPLRHTLMRLGP